MAGTSHLKNLPLAEPLGTSGTVWYEEVTLQVPDCRSVDALFNSAPIRSEDGDLEALVVTLQVMSLVESL